ncbi:MAG: hypothetical protein MPJ78_18550 [Hyphomicrobiaceae bacterium]|nr:hypothetical protein [Hyphomicrobiaceae bacterium]
MHKKFFRMVALGGAVFAASHSVAFDTAHAGSTIDLGSFLSKHSGKIDSLVSRYGLESIGEKYLNTKDETGEHSANKNSNSNEKYKLNLDDILNHSSLRKLR